MIQYKYINNKHMNLFKKILKIVFIVLGVIFLLLLLGIGYLWIADPFNLKALTGESISPTAVIKALNNDNIEIDNIDKNPLLSEIQEAQLESIGVDPASLPTTITAEMQACFIEKLGSQRANEIIQGSAPTTMDFLKANDCIK